MTRPTHPQARRIISRRLRTIAHKVRGTMASRPGRPGREAASQELNEYLRLNIISWSEYAGLMQELSLDTQLGVEL